MSQHASPSVGCTPLRVSRTPEVAYEIFASSGQVPTVAQVATRLRLSPFAIIRFMRERDYEMIDFCPCPEDEPVVLGERHG